MSLIETSSLPDQASRDRFINNISENFSVIAPAGVGKTTAITNRITNFIINDARTEIESSNQTQSLVVVTYTEKAAKEIKNRVFSKIANLENISMALKKLCLQRMDKAFFGTIHSFAANFLKKYHLSLGLPLGFEIVESDDAIWQKFLADFGDVSKIIPEKLRNDFTRTQNISSLIEEARTTPAIDLYGIVITSSA